MEQNSLGVITDKEGFFGRFLTKVLFIALLMALFWSPLWFGTPQNKELQKTLIENKVDLKPQDASPSSLFSSAYVALFQNSYPNKNLEYLLFFIGIVAVLALAMRCKVLLKSHNVTYAGLGWALIMLPIMASGKMSKLAQFRDPWGTALFVLYGAFFYAAAVGFLERKRRDAAAVVICLAMIVVAFNAAAQFHGGLERTRELYAQEQGFSDFAAYTNNWLAGTHNAEETYSFQRLVSPRVSANFTSPNILAAYSMLAFFVALGLWKSSRTKVIKTLGGAAALLALQTLFYTRSKSVIAITFVMAAAWAFALFKARELSKTWLFVILGGGALFTAASFLWGYGANLGAKLSSSGDARLTYWKVAVRMLRQKPLTGCGYNSFDYWYRAWKPANAEPSRFVHNTILQMWAEFGMFAALGSLLALTLPFVNGWDNFKFSFKKDAFQLACIVASIGFFLHNLLDFDFYVPGLMLTGLFVLSMALRGREDDDSNEETKDAAVPAQN